ncbi:CotH kinase family protein [Anaeropeptidivorans aminofermentans]|uniref:CotH kinase family protein n=1 Tax=Anaeropeptidivorans aminofermentans TaxID=2934315 RepID=UPI0020241EB4|nr:CotH kinase family protein [Anaeropeptidivorans aminofermentans]
MIRNKYIDKISIIACVLALVITILFMNGSYFGIQAAQNDAPYVNKLFDDTSVHSLDIVIDEKDWNSILENPRDKEYVQCNIVIDGEAYKNVAIRTKGNSSLSSVASMDSDRYSFKIEFDHYDGNMSYYGLDKLSLNNIIQDSTYLKDYLSYHMMNEIGIAAPLSSFVNISVNGEDFGLYLAVEAVEEAFIERTYGNISGTLYKPDNMQMGNFSDAARSSSRDNSASLQYTDDNSENYNTIWDGAVLNDPSQNDKERLIESLKILNSGEDLETAVDIESVLKYFVVHNFVLNFDSYTGNMLHNYYLYEVDGKISMIPWDYNLAFGSFAGGRGGSGSSSSATQMVNFPIDTPLSGTTLEERPLLGKLLENTEYMALYHEYFKEFISDYFENGKFQEEYDRAVNLISDYVKNDPTAFYTFEAFEEGTEALKEFCLLRAESIMNQLNGTIPSTSEGQSENPDSLINADHLSMSAMGSMGGFGNMQSGENFRQNNLENISNTFNTQDENNSNTSLIGGLSQNTEIGTETGAKNINLISNGKTNEKTEELPVSTFPSDNQTPSSEEKSTPFMGEASPLLPAEDQSVEAAAIQQKSNPAINENTSLSSKETAKDTQLPSEAETNNLPEVPNTEGNNGTNNMQSEQSFRGGPPNMQGQGGFTRGQNMPGGNFQNAVSENDSSSDFSAIIMFSGSIILLVAGSLFVVKYKRF